MNTHSRAYNEATNPMNPILRTRVRRPAFLKATASPILLAFIGFGISACLPSALQAQPSCVPAPAGLIAWWRAEGDATDAVSTNNGTLMNGATFAPGEVGQAFSLDGINDYVSIPLLDFS